MLRAYAVGPDTYKGRILTIKGKRSVRCDFNAAYEQSPMIKSYGSIA